MPNIIKLVISLFLLILSVQVYAYTIPPTGGKPIVVHVGLYVNDFTAIYEKIEVLELEATLYTSWQDKRLAFSGNDTKYYNGKLAEETINSIWHPNLTIAHARSTRKIDQQTLSITPDGTVSHIQRFKLDLEITINMRAFPFDDQDINIAVIPFTKNYNQMKFKIANKRQGISKLAHLPQWYVKGVSLKVGEIATDSIGPNTPAYILTIHYDRKSNFYVLKVLFPLVVIVILSWSVFWLIDQPIVNSVAIGLMALLTIIAFQWVIADNTPKVSYHTFFDALLTLSYTIVGLTIVALARINTLASVRSLRLARICRILFPVLYIIGLAIIIYIFLW